MDGKATGGRRVGELRRVGVGALAIVLAVAAVTALFSLFARWANVEFDYFSRDVAAVLNGPFYAGTYANLTILVWSAPAAVALTTSYVLRRAGHSRQATMMLVVGLVTALMVIDDFFLVHEALNQYLHVSQKAEPLAYFVMVVGFAGFYRRQLGVNALLAIAALGCWGASAVLDNLVGEADFAVEDGTKLLGVGLWTYLVFRLATAALLELRDGAAEEVGEIDEHEDGRLADDPDDPLDDRNGEALAAPVPARGPRREPDATLGARARLEDVATTPIPPARRTRSARHQFTELATAAVPGVRSRMAAGGHPFPARRGTGRHELAPEPGGSRPEVNGHAVPHPRNGRARHRCPDD